VAVILNAGIYPFSGLVLGPVLAQTGHGADQNHDPETDDIMITP